jgi:hypothetical protein
MPIALLRIGIVGTGRESRARGDGFRSRKRHAKHRAKVF